MDTVNRAVLAVYSGSETLQACSLLSLQWTTLSVTWSYSALPRTHRLRSSHTRMCAFHACFRPECVPRVLVLMPIHISVSWLSFFNDVRTHRPLSLPPPTPHTRPSLLKLKPLARGACGACGACVRACVRACVCVCVCVCSEEYNNDSI